MAARKLFRAGRKRVGRKRFAASIDRDEKLPASLFPSPSTGRVSSALDRQSLERLRVLPVLGGRTCNDSSHGISRARGAFTQDGHGGVEGRSLGGEPGKDAIVEECDGRLGAKAAMALDLAKGVGQRPALDHEAIKAH